MRSFFADCNSINLETDSFRIPNYIKQNLMKNHPQSSVSQSGLTCIEICSGAGGQAIGLERAGFEGLAHVEYDRHACETLRLNRLDWNVVERAQNDSLSSAESKDFFGT